MTDDVEVIAELEERRYDAMRRSDDSALAELCDDELTYTHSDADERHENQLFATHPRRVLRLPAARARDLSHGAGR